MLIQIHLWPHREKVRRQAILPTMKFKTDIPACYYLH
jgi:hypothetical protein